MSDLNEKNLELEEETVDTVEAPAAEEPEAKVIEINEFGEEVKEIIIDQEFADEQARKKKIREFWDKVTTGIFILLLSSPFLVILYIILWFVNVS